MAREDIISMIDTMGLYYDTDHPDHISEDAINSIAPPFLEADIIQHVIPADGENYIDDIFDVTLRIYSEATSVSEESTVTSVLSEEDLRWRRDCKFNDYMQLFEISYKFQA